MRRERSEPPERRERRELAGELASRRGSRSGRRTGRARPTAVRAAAGLLPPARHPALHLAGPHPRRWRRPATPRSPSRWPARCSSTSAPTPPAARSRSTCCSRWRRSPSWRRSSVRPSTGCRAAGALMVVICLRRPGRRQRLHGDVHLDSLRAVPAGVRRSWCWRSPTPSPRARSCRPSCADDEELVEANSKLGLLAGIVGFVAALPAVLLKLIDVRITPRAWPCCCTSSPPAWRRGCRRGGRSPPTPAGPRRRQELRSGGHRAGGVGDGRSSGRSSGFLTFLLAFWLRSQKALRRSGSASCCCSAPSGRWPATRSARSSASSSARGADAGRSPSSSSPSAACSPPSAAGRSSAALLAGVGGLRRPRSPDWPSTPSCSGTRPTPTGAGPSPSSRPASSSAGSRRPSSRWSSPSPGRLGFLIVSVLAAFALALLHRRVEARSGAGQPLPPTAARPACGPRSRRRRAAPRRAGTTCRRRTPPPAEPVAHATRGSVEPVVDLEAGQPEAGRVDLGRSGQGTGRRPQPGQARLALALDHAARRRPRPGRPAARVSDEPEEPLDEDVVARRPPPAAGARPRRCGRRSTMTCPAAWSTVWSTKPTMTATRASSRGRRRSCSGELDGAEQDLGIAEQLLQLVHGAAAAGIEVAEPVGQRARVGPEAADVIAQEPLELGPDVGHAERRRGEVIWCRQTHRQQLVARAGSSPRRRPRRSPGGSGSRRSAGGAAGGRTGRRSGGPAGPPSTRWPCRAWSAPRARGAGPAWPGPGRRRCRRRGARPRRSRSSAATSRASRPRSRRAGGRRRGCGT